MASKYPMIQRKVGSVTILVPDYSKPGVAEAVDAEVFAEDFASVSPRSSSTELYLIWKRNQRHG